MAEIKILRKPDKWSDNPGSINGLSCWQRRQLVGQYEIELWQDNGSVCGNLVEILPDKERIRRASTSIPTSGDSEPDWKSAGQSILDLLTKSWITKTWPSET